MRRYFRVFALVFSLFLGMILGPRSALAWGSATHAYIAEAFHQEEANPLEVYGGMAPDLFNLMTDSPEYDYLIKQTHRSYNKVVKKAKGTELAAFAFGFATHNETKGADYTAHRKGCTTKEGYVITKSDELAPKLRPAIEGILESAGVEWASLWAGPLALELAHPVIEMAVDLLIKRNESPLIGTVVFESARDRPSTVADLLIEAYAAGFSKRLDLSYEEASEFIRGAEAEFQQLMIRYGEILILEEEEAIQELAVQGASLIEGYVETTLGTHVEFPEEVIVDFLHLARAQVEMTYGQEIALTIESVRKRLANLSRILEENSAP